MSTLNNQNDTYFTLNLLSLLLNRGSLFGVSFELNVNPRIYQAALALEAYIYKSIVLYLSNFLYYIFYV